MEYYKMKVNLEKAEGKILYQDQKSAYYIVQSMCNTLVWSSFQLNTLLSYAQPNE